MKPIKFKIEKINVLRSEVRDHPVVLNENFSFDNNIELQISTKFNYDDNLALNFIHFQFDAIATDLNKITLAHFDFTYTYFVKDLQANINDDEYKRLLNISLLSVTYSTSRGIIFSKTMGFAINELYIAPVNPNKLYESLLNEKS
ncbi:MAG: hypothetical protein IPQ02_13320 [Saprospiraceae bacterium]|nr:hypothetical protein [Candidatus Defluviibacterium haderslevense]